MAKEEIVVFGAGVIGLSCASTLVELGYNVTVAAAQFHSDPYSTDYTSVWAGAHYRPMPVPNYAGGLREAEYTKLTYRHFEEVSKEHPESSIVFTTGYEIVEKPKYELEDKFYRSAAEFKQIDPKSIVKSAPSSAFACSYKTFVLNPPVYLSFLTASLKKKGVTFVRTAKLESIEKVFNLFPDSSIVINASATGLQYDGSFDPNSYQIRGQTLLLKVPSSNVWQKSTLTYQLANGQWCFNIPRPMSGDCIIIGGTKQIGDTTATPKDSDTKQLLDNASKVFPEITESNYKIERINVGLRPARKEGSRVQAEKCAKGRAIVHAYGLGGMGFETSWGVASHVSKLVTQLSFNNAKL